MNGSNYGEWERGLKWEMLGRRNNGRSESPVGELMRAVMLTAINDLYGSSELRSAALEFFWSREEDHIFSFQFMCRFFGMEPIKSRRAILRSVKRIRTKRRPYKKYETSLLVVNGD